MKRLLYALPVIFITGMIACQGGTQENYPEQGEENLETMQAPAKSSALSTAPKESFQCDFDQKIDIDTVKKAEKYWDTIPLAKDAPKQFSVSWQQLISNYRNYSYCGFVVHFGKKSKSKSLKDLVILIEGLKNDGSLDGKKFWVTLNYPEPYSLAPECKGTYKDSCDKALANWQAFKDSLDENDTFGKKRILVPNNHTFSIWKIDELVADAQKYENAIQGDDIIFKCGVMGLTKLNEKYGEPKEGEAHYGKDKELDFIVNVSWEKKHSKETILLSRTIPKEGGKGISSKYYLDVSCPCPGPACCHTQ